MRFFLLLVTAAAIALGGGIGTAWLALEEGMPLAAVIKPPWVAWPEAGAADADPYSRAAMARSGMIPFTPGEGILLVAARDSTGNPLRPGCDYSVVGHGPSARVWTLAVTDPSGVPSTVAGRVVVDSRSLLRGPDGGYEIRVAPSARPGNWLAAPATPYRLVLRIYGALEAGEAVDLDPATLPAVMAGSCS